MKIMTNGKYNELVNKAKSYQNMYNKDTTALLLHNKDYELKINEINNRLKDILNMNSKTAKNVILGHIKGIVKFIERGI